MTEFDYALAFSRNIGWVTVSEQARLRQKRVAIAGMGGVGGLHLLALTRLGIGKFTIADPDSFEMANFNRQAGATLSTLNQPKAEAMARAALDINPELDLRVLRDPIGKSNLAEFLADADLYVDGLDFFAFDARQATFRACAERGIPAITVAPLGMGASLLNFLPGGITFDQYFCWDKQTEEEKALRFLIGLAPARLHMGYLVDPSRVDLANKRGPSTGMATQLCAGIAATEALKILLGRGKVLAAPWGMHFDAYTNRLRRTWRPGGNANPLQRLLIFIARYLLRSKVTR